MPPRRCPAEKSNNVYKRTVFAAPLKVPPRAVSRIARRIPGRQPTLFSIVRNSTHTSELIEYGPREEVRHGGQATRRANAKSIRQARSRNRGWRTRRLAESGNAPRRGEKGVG